MIDISNMFRLFRSQYQEIRRYVRSFFDWKRMIHEISQLYYIYVLLCCRKRCANGRVFITLWKWRGLNFACCIVINVFCNIAQTVVLLADWSLASTEFAKGSIKFEFVRSSFFNCIEKKGKIRIP